MRRGGSAVKKEALEAAIAAHYTRLIDASLSLTFLILASGAAAVAIALGVVAAWLAARARVAAAALKRREAECGEAEKKLRELSVLARKQEEQLEHSTRLAELGEMAAAISHELNQPLTGIRNYARNAYYMLEQKAGGEEEVKGNLRLISEQVDRAARITNQMRELTRRSDSTFVALDVNGVLRECVEFVLPQMKLSDVELSLSLAEDLPQIWGDRIRLAQVFLNLLTNARQAMDGAAQRKLSIASRRDDRPGLPVAVEVADTGKGFSAEQARSLFQPFYTTRKGGHGLGLSISRAIIQDHKGVIEAAGVPGAGATFTIWLPAAARDDRAGQPSGSAH